MEKKFVKDQEELNAFIGSRGFHWKGAGLLYMLNDDPITFPCVAVAYDYDITNSMSHGWALEVICVTLEDFGIRRRVGPEPSPDVTKDLGLAERNKAEVAAFQAWKKSKNLL